MIGVVNYMIPDKVLGHIAEKPVRHILTVIGVLKTQFLTAFWDHIEFQRDQSTLESLSHQTILLSFPLPLLVLVILNSPTPTVMYATSSTSVVVSVQDL